MKYIDTSALVKYYGSPELEKGAEAIIQLIEQARQGKHVLVTSLFTLGEAISAFDRWVRLRAITEEELAALVSRFLTDIEELNDAGCLIIENVTALSVMFSIDHILTHHLPINDALHG